MKTRVAINGFGRIGRAAFKIAFRRSDIEVVAINDLTDCQTLAHLLKHDSVYGAYEHKVNSDESNLIVDDKTVKVLRQPDPALLPWADLGVDVVIEATGQFTEPNQALVHLNPAGAKKVIISASVKGDEVSTIIIGANEDQLKDAGGIISAGGSSSACITPILDILAQNFGIDKALTTTIHSLTSEQKIVDRVASDWREARAAGHNIVPMSKPANIAVSQAQPDLNGKIENLSVKVPTLAVSLADLSVLLKRPATVEEINDTFKKAAAEPYYQGILTVCDEELVSSDFIGNSHSAIVDLKLTKVVGGNLVKVVAWYDNEWGYANRLVELVADTGKLLHGNSQPAPDANLQEVNITQEQL